MDADRALVEAVLENRPGAFEQLVRDYQGLCWHVIQRMILTLYHLEELPIGEIAAITGLADGTIKSHLFRSRNRLRELLAPRIGVAA